MTPTNKLRFVEREISQHQMITHRKVLQQWWAPFKAFHDGYGYTSMELEGGEWRDVPLEEENK